MTEALIETLPEHVPTDLIREFPFLQRGRIISNTTPWKLFDQMIAEQPPIFWAKKISEAGGGWVVNSGHAVKSLLADTTHFSNKAKFSIRKISRRNILPILSASDAPEHNFYRGFASPMFAAKRFTAMEDDIRAIAREFIEKFAQNGECEFMTEFAVEFPIKVFLLMMGLPLEMMPQFLAWEHQMFRGANLEVDAGAINDVCDYLDGEIQERRLRPRDDLITYGIVSEFRGRHLNEEELLGYCFNLFAGGLDTVSASMSHQFIHLAQHPEQQAVLRADPSLISDAVDELTRAYGVVIQMRDCVAPIEICGQMVLPGGRLAGRATPRR